MSLCFSRFRLAPTILLTCGMLVGAGVALAQQGPPPGGGSRGMRPHGDQSQHFDPVVFEGPPGPDSMATLVGLDANGLTRYTTMYQNMMAATRSERDSLASMRQARQASRESGAGTPGAGPGGMREIRQYLEEKQKEFDQALGDLLNPDQLKHYQAWREQRRHEPRPGMRGRREVRNDPQDEPPNQ